LSTWTVVRWWSLLRLLNRVLALQSEITKAQVERRGELTIEWQKTLKIWIPTPNSHDAFKAHVEQPEGAVGPTPAPVGIDDAVVEAGRADRVLGDAARWT
jgi:hypothetical protein